MLKFALRVLWKNRLFSFLNIVGLTFGLSASIWLLLFLSHELTYDQHFTHHQRVYRVSHVLSAPGVEFNTAFSAPELPEKMMEELPGIENFSRFGFVGRGEIQHNNQVFRQERMYYTDPSVFDVFDLKLMAGHAKTALKNPGSVVISKTVNDKLFGNDMGLNRTITIDGQKLNITGVYANLPKNTHFAFDVLISGVRSREFAMQNGTFNSEALWNAECITYLLLQEGTTKEDILSKFGPFNEKYYMPFGNQINGKHRLRLQALADIHYDAETIDDDFAKGNPANLLVFSMVGLAILLLACINYINLSTARAGLRAKEIGIRKVLGTHATRLRTSLLVESLVQAFFAYLLSLLLVWLLIEHSPLQSWLGVNFNFNLFNNPSLLAGTLLVVAVTGLVAGLYPAFYLSAIKPVSALKGTWSSGKKGQLMRQGLVLFQFVISIGVLLSTLLMKDQIAFLQNKDMGFEKDQILLITTADSVTQSKYTSMKNALETFPVIEKVTSSDFLPGTNIGQIVFKAEMDGEMKQIEFKYLHGGADYLETLGIPLAEGEFFSPNETRGNAKFVINQTAAKAIGWQEPLGKKMGFFHQEQPGHVIGVVRDFNHFSLHNPIEPLVFVFNPNPGQHLIVRFNQNNAGEALAAAQQVWNEQLPNYPFEYSFFNDRLNEQYEADKTQSQLIGFMTILCAAISIIGLIGLTSFTIDQRRKEIGIRKVLGAMSGQIVTIMYSGTFKLILLASLIATPLAYWGINRWSQNFIYQSQLNIGLLLTGLAVALCTSFVLVAAIVMNSALKNPVKTLRQE
ncbi:ABC transporter permease [Roseivirga sp. UBA838]|uniref:ABC transporter permease n=1 Tax=Roseivirga sp. UBA838 TaxID=1947393 RepID=UPI00257B0B44|nr:ABC transporter permease [Roseivirga sp. UBA838]|tara:strand:+ start:71450 stop:73837 length:2388 start_codon:yes stop_codon:yes gene_type:complete